MSETKVVNKLRFGVFSITEFEHPKTDERNYTTKSFSLQKSVLKKDGDAKKSEDWINTNIYINADERAKIITLLQKSLSTDVNKVE